MDLQRILVPLDGSELSERALPMTEQLARRSGAELILARAPLARIFAGMDAIEADEAQANVLIEVEAYLMTISRQLAERGLRVQIATPISSAPDAALDQVIRPVFPFRQLAAIYRQAAETIAREADARAVDLIVMATHGRSGLRRWVYGSVALDVLRHASIPVLLFRSSAPDRLPEGANLRIMVPLDGSAFGESALPGAVYLARLLGGSLVLIQAVPELQRSSISVLLGPLGSDPTELAALEAAAHSYLEDVRLTLEAQNIRAEAVVIEGDPKTAVLDAVREQHCALIAVATHGRGELSRLAAGSVAEAITTNASVPVLVVHSAGLEEEQRIVQPSAEHLTDQTTNGAATIALEEPTAPTATVDLTDEDLEILQSALQTLRQVSDRHAHLAEPIQQLLDKLDAARATLPAHADR